MSKVVNIQIIHDVISLESELEAESIDSKDTVKFEIKEET